MSTCGSSLHKLWAVWLVAACVLAGCSSVGEKTVLVLDDRGRPVPGAKVQVETLTQDLPATWTASDGVAPVNDRTDQLPQWIIVSKPGYLTRKVGYRDVWPLRVLLPGEGGEGIR